MIINDHFLQKVEKRYKEMKDKGIFEDYFDENLFGEIKIFINKSPKYSLMPLIKIESDYIYVGSEELDIK